MHELTIIFIILSIIGLFGIFWTYRNQKSIANKLVVETRRNGFFRAILVEKVSHASSLH